VISSDSSSSPYARGIIGQTESLQAALDAALPASVADAVRDGFARFSGVVVTGMGSGPFASYPAWLRLAQAGVPAWVVETAELLNAASGMLSSDHLLVVVSQSGESAEVVALLERLGAERPTLLAVVNNLESPLAAAADLVVPLNVGSTRPDTAGTGTYINTLVATARLVDSALGVDTSADFAHAADRVADYLAAWESHVAVASSLDLPSHTSFVLARGASLASARTGALLVKEAAKVHAEAMSSSEFRHGPLELVDTSFAAVMLAGDATTLHLNLRMAEDIQQRGGTVGWVGTTPGTGTHLTMPHLSGTARPIAEILPLQVLSVAAAIQGGHAPGTFRHASRVTRVL
jgi:glucosamine--fructose-6-phosphate aminotransferase (isomerizing)